MQQSSSSKQKWRAEDGRFHLNADALPPSLSPPLSRCRSLSEREMQNEEGESTRTKMESLRMICDEEISAHQQKVESFATSFLSSLQSMKDKSQETIQSQGRLLKFKSSLKEAENELVRSLAAKTRSEAKRMATMELVSAVKTRIEELKKVLQDQKARRNEYAAIISRESSALAAAEEKNEQETRWKEEIQDAISWYNRVFCLRIEGGNGVKFMFNNVDVKRPDEVYSFTIRHANDTYTLLQCDPPLDSTKELVLELNKSNDLYKFVRIMRKKFQEAAGEGSLPQMITLPQESSAISVSAPVASISTDISETPTRELEDRQIQDTDLNKNIKKANLSGASKVPVLSPGSASSLRRSSRLTKVKK